MTNEQYYELITPYEDASKVMLTKLDILNHHIYKKNPHKPVHHIENRIKSKRSMEEKLLKLGITDSVMHAKERLKDIAGIRVICYFPDEVYDLVNALRCQNDLLILQEKDYISNPKENGYRSYHVIYGVPLYCMDAMEYFPVEIQFRTIAMDLWASMEHRINYKKEREDKAKIANELQQYAMALELMEDRFESMRDLKSDMPLYKRQVPVKEIYQIEDASYSEEIIVEDA